MLSGGFRLLLQSRFHLLPRRRAEEESLPHGFRHVLKPAHGNGEAQFIGSYAWANGWVKKTEESSLSMPVILHYGHRSGRATSRTELRDDGISSICFMLFLTALFRISASSHRGHLAERTCHSPSRQGYTPPICRRCASAAWR